MKQYDVIVVGAGLAGLSAAFELSKKAKNVLVLEAREIVGGRTASWDENGMKVESGLHRFLGVYRALPNLIEQAGVNLEDILLWEDEIEIRNEHNVHAVFGASILKPVKSVAGFLGNNSLLNPIDKASLFPFFAAGIKDYETEPEKLDSITVLAYAKKHKVTSDAIHNFLIPLTAGIFFLPPEKYSAFALFSLITPYLTKLPTLRIGAFKGGMTDVMCGPIAKAIVKNGGTVKTHTPVYSLLVDKDIVKGVKVHGKELRSEHVILATSLGPAQRLIKKSFRDNSWFSNMLSLPTMSAVTIQFELTKPSMEVDHTTFGPGTCWASFAEQSRTTFRQTKGRLSVILTPPDKFLKMDPKKTLEIVINDGKKLGIDITKTIKNYRIISEPDDFYALVPKTEKLRPSQKTPIKGLSLAGDYTKQPYVATMEGAVTSGKLAADLVLGT